jgi:prepilin peptidase CpaA
MDLLFAVVLTLAVVYDLRERRIPNALTVGGLFAALVLRLVIDPVSAVGGLQGAGLGLVVALPLFALGAFGAGDGKLVIAMGAFLGWEGLPAALLVTGVVGGFLSLVYAVRRGVLIPVLYQARDLALYCFTLGRAGERRTLSGPSGTTVPYGVAIAVGAAVVWMTGAPLP